MKKPLIERYLTYLRVSGERASTYLRTGGRILPGSYEFNVASMQNYSDLHTQMAEQAYKYQLASSAQTMIEALRPRPLLREEMSFAVMDAIASHTHTVASDIETPILRLPDRSIWLELEQPIATTSREIAGLFFSCIDRQTEYALTQHQSATRRAALEATGRQQGENYAWCLHFIDKDGTSTTRYVYREQGQAWEIEPNADPCPLEECVITQEVYAPTGKTYRRLVPCSFCATLLAYWRSWFVTALLAAQGEFAATEEAQWPVQTERTTRKVLRPGSHNKYQEIAVSHDYYLVSFDASIRKHHNEPTIQREPEARGSWVALAQEVDPESVVYVRHDFGQGQRHLDPERNPRWRSKRTIDVKAYARRIPMRVDRLQHRITRVLASTYEHHQQS